MTGLQFARELGKRGPLPWTFQTIQQGSNQAEDFAVLHASQIMDVIDPAEAMRARTGDLLARRALKLRKRATRPGIHHVKRAKKERRAAAKETRDARAAGKRGKAIIDSNSSSQSEDEMRIANSIRELERPCPVPHRSQRDLQKRDSQLRLPNSWLVV